MFLHRFLWQFHGLEDYFSSGLTCASRVVPLRNTLAKFMPTSSTKWVFVLFAGRILRLYRDNNSAVVPQTLCVSLYENWNPANDVI